MNENPIPADTLEQIHILAAEGLAVNQIAFMLHLAESAVRAELDQVNTTSAAEQGSKSEPSDDDAGYS